MGPGYRHVACCIEGSSASDAVIDAGTRLVDGHEGTLTLLHVVPPPMAVLALPAPDMSAVYAEAEAWLAQRAESVRAAMRAGGSEAAVQTALLEGHPGIAVCEWAGHHDADLIVAASHRGLFDRALLGSFAGYVAYHAPCAVHLVRPVAAEKG
ncbi:MAG: universal stress protein [Thermoleophilia bacterium]|nr:universal stress protein [Thermoleophilia bacterium]